MRRIPRVVPHERRCRRSKGAPPETADAVRLDALAKDGSPARSLGLERGFERVDGGQDHPEGGGAKRGKDVLNGDG